MKQDEWAQFAAPQMDEAAGAEQPPEPELEEPQAAEPEPEQEPEQQQEHGAAAGDDMAGRLAALQAENRRCETRLFAYERLIKDLQAENSALRRKCSALSAQAETLKLELLAAGGVQQPAAQAAPATPEQLEALSAGLLERLDDILTQK